jgi:outer membrane protein assembly factor BamB
MAAAAVIQVLFVCSTHAADWPQWRGPNRDGLSSEKGWYATWPPKKAWTASVGIGYSSFAVVGERAYVIGHTPGDGEKGIDVVYCLDAKTGQAVWTHKYECLTTKKDKTGDYPGPRTTPVVVGDAVYIVSLEGHLFCLDAADGSVRWYKDLGKFAIEDGEMMYGYCSTPLVYGDKLMAYLNGAVMAFDRNTGKPLWRSKGGGGPWNVPSPIAIKVGDEMHVVMGEMAIVGVNIETGKKAWEYYLGRSSTMTPVSCGKTIFFSTYPNKGQCGMLTIEGGEAKLVWQNRDMQVYHIGNPVCYDGNLYGIDSSRTEYSYSDTKVSRLKCLDMATGETKWEEKKMGWAQLIIADGKLIIMREGGELVIAEASPDAYKELGRQQIADGPVWAVPALVSGRIYIRNNAGDAVCLQVGPE